MKHQEASKYILSGATCPLNDLEERFSFIKNKVLKKNIAITFHYLIFLASLDTSSIADLILLSSLYKDMIVYTASILEGILHYALKECLIQNRVKYAEVMKSDWQFKDCKTLYKISDDAYVCGVVRYKKTECLNDQTNFMVINRACKRAGILSKDLFEQAEKIRKWRNKIHLSSLSLTEDGYTKADSQEAFAIAKAIIPSVEDWLALA